MIFRMSLLQLARPRQWLKNVLVAAGPMSASEFSRSTMAKTALAFVSVTLMAIAGYVVNDIRDRHLDGEHAVRRKRPIAAGTVSVSKAQVFMVMAAIGSVVVAALTREPGVLAAVAVYGILSFSYSRWLKHFAIIELFAVAGCIVLRTIVGAQAAQVPLSRWFILVVGFAALYVVTSKRSSELLDGYDPAKTRPVLAKYPDGFLDFIRILSIAATVITYCLWAFDRSTASSGPWFELSIPFVVGGLLRFEMLVRSSRAGTVEDVIFDDAPFRWTALAWAALFLVGTLRA
jgi:decaprenyl-phosphate phosphoribosyltransferase